jgi:superfamily II DNA or RNA helicase
MRTFNTGDSPNIGLEKLYDGIWQVSATSKSHLLSLEKILHIHFSAKRQKRSNGKLTEWFKVSYEEVVDFLKSQGFVIRQLSVDEVRIIQEKSEHKPSSEELITYKEETELMAEQKGSLENSLDYTVLFKKFISVFLPGKLPRRVQVELWDKFSEICSNPEEISYKGIVQWPTGVGKTFAILMLTVIAKERCTRRGTIYRGLFVSPKNDIINTISGDFDKLSLFGIKVYDGSNGKLSELPKFPSNQHMLIVATQKALTDERTLKRLPKISHVHYDEVHRITGQLYFTLLKDMLEEWKSEFLTGTSATPFTCSPSQREKIAELFGNPLNLLHRCGVDEAVKEGWIAKPRFIVCIIPPIDDTNAHLRGTVEALGKYIHLKGKEGKFICYIESRISDVKVAAEIAREMLPWAKIYTAIDGDRSDGEFIAAPIDKTPKILFACQRFREGSDIRGLEMTAKLMGNTSAAYILLQICGRAGRIDGDKDKEGWCLLIRPSEQGTSEQDVLDSILLDVIEFMGKSDKVLTKKETEDLLRIYIGDVSLNGTTCSLEETIERVQAAYIRKEYAKRTPKEKYTLVRAENKELGIVSKDDYMERGASLIKDPKVYFKDWWVSWYDFLGVDTSGFPQTKSDWIRVCKEMGLEKWDDYKKSVTSTLPANPGEMYEDYENWDKEFGVEDEVVW